METKIKKVKPQNDWILLELEPSTEYHGAIYLPTSAQEKQIRQTGEVVAVGQGNMQKNGRRYQADLKPGKTIIFAPIISLIEMKNNGKEFTFIGSSDVIATCRKQDDDIDIKSIEPQNDWVLIELEPPEEKRGKIHIPYAAQKEQQRRMAKVIAVGPGIMGLNGKRRSMDIVSGDIIIYDSVASILVMEDDGKDYTFTGKDDILCTCNENITERVGE